MCTMRYVLLVWFCVTLVIPHYVRAETAYVTSGELSPLLLSPPPAEGSMAWKKNIDAVLAAQKHVDADTLNALRAEQHVTLDLLTNVVGKDFTRDAYPHIFVFLEQVLADAEAVSKADKLYWHTRRPYLTDARVKLYVDRIDQSPAYPSGHTTDTRVLAEVLGMLFPQHLDDLRARAELIALHRVMAGVHYPVDLEGGRMLAMLIVGAMSANDSFQADLAKAKEEIRP